MTFGTITAGKKEKTDEKLLPDMYKQSVEKREMKFYPALVHCQIFVKEDPNAPLLMVPVIP